MSVMARSDSATLIYLLLLAAAVGWMVYPQFRRQLGSAARLAVTWVFIFLAVIAAYGLWEDVSHISLFRTSVEENSPAVRLQRQDDGHFYADLIVNGAKTRFLIDTGATGVILSAADAAAAGINPSRLNYSGQAATANGVIQTAYVSIDKLRLGNFIDFGFPASVTRSDIPVSLLGQTYLSQFANISIDYDTLTIANKFRR